ncbi:hypothetical protein, partial [Streptomyces sp. NPDC055085]
LLICRGSTADQQVDDSILGIVDSVIREHFGIPRTRQIGSKEEEAFWKKLTPTDIDAMTPERRAAILACDDQVVYEYWAREREGAIGSGANPAKMKAAVIALAVAANSAKDAAEIYRRRSDQVAKDSANQLLKAANFTLIAIGIMQGKIERHVLEQKKSTGRPRGPGGKLEEKVPGGRADPLTGFSLSRQTLSQVLDMRRMVEKQRPRPPGDILAEWRSFGKATEKFLTNPDISRVSAKDALREIGGL